MTPSNLEYSRKRIRRYFLCFLYMQTLFSFTIINYANFDFSKMKFDKLLTFVSYIIFFSLYITIIYFMLRKPYLIIHDDFFIKRGPGNYTFLKRRFYFDKIVNSTRKSNFFLGGDYISFKTKNSLPKRILLDNLSKEDKQKIIEVFREKGLLKE